MSISSNTRDTVGEAALVYEASYASLTGPERVERSMQMAEEVKQVTLAGIAHRNPDASPEEIHREWLLLLHGPDIVDLLV